MGREGAGRIGWRPAVLGLLLLAAAACGRPEPPLSPPVLAPKPAAQCTFLAVGRQGYGDRATREVAVAMEAVARARGTVSFALLLGDNFYPTGVRDVDDPQWRTKFEDLYDGAHLRGMPFYALLGNHDHQGSIEAELAYAREGRGSGRWTMEGPHYAKDVGDVEGRPLARIVFLDSVMLHGLGTYDPVPPEARTRTAQIRFLREAFAAEPLPLWRIVASHYSARSQTRLEYSKARVMPELLPVLRDVKADLFLSANDRFQQVLDEPGEPLHVGTNGGGRKIESIDAVDTARRLAVSRRGFALVSLDAESLTVELFDASGDCAHARVRARRSVR